MTDFSNVNIHKDSDQATNIGALAYTQGNSVHFAPGQYEPGSTKGQELLGHELTHVVQQREGRVKPDTEQHKGLNINSDTTLEKEADDMGALAAQGKMANVRGNGSGVQRKDPPIGARRAIRHKTSNQGISRDNDPIEFDRAATISNINLSISMNYTTFGLAAEEVYRDIQAEKQAKIDIISLLIDIACIWIVPKLGKLLGGVAKRMSTGASGVVAKQSLSRIDEVANTIAGIGKSEANKYVKTKLASSTEEALLNALVDGFKIRTYEIGKYCNDNAEKPEILSDADLLVIDEMFKPSNNPESTYKEILKNEIDRYNAQILPIGKTTSTNTTVPQSQTFGKNGIAWIVDGSSKRLALFEYEKTTTLQGQSSSFNLITYIDDDMQELAIEVAKEKQPNGIQELPVEYFNQ